MDNNMNNNQEDAIERIIRLSPAIVNLIIVCANIIIFLLCELTGSTLDTAHMRNCGASYVPLIRDEHQYWRLFTSMFLHFGIAHLGNNMLLLFFLGDILERQMGRIKYFLLYIIGGLGANIISYALSLKSDDMATSAGASGAIFAVVGAMIYVLVINKGRVENLTFERTLAMAVLTLLAGFTGDNVDNAAHVGGLITGIALAVILYRRKGDTGGS